MMSNEERLCICGHGAHWHADGGEGVCEHGAECVCTAFRAAPGVRLRPEEIGATSRHAQGIEITEAMILRARAELPDSLSQGQVRVALTAALSPTPGDPDYVADRFYREKRPPTDLIRDDAQRAGDLIADHAGLFTPTRRAITMLADALDRAADLLDAHQKMLIELRNHKADA